MTNENVFDQVARVISQQLNIELEDIKLESNLKDDLNADSLDLVEVVMALEEEFEESAMEISDDEAEKMITVGDIVKYISDKV